MQNEEDDCLLSKRPEPKPSTRRKVVTSENWRRTLYFGSFWAIVVLLFNLGFVIWAEQHQLGDDGNVLFNGDCEKSKKISTGLHLVINILGTVLLGASNYGMVSREQSSLSSIYKGETR